MPRDHGKTARVHRRGRAALAGAAWALVLATCATPLEQQRWIRAETEHFSLISGGNPEQTREVARKLELFRAVLLAITELAEIPERIPTLVYVFGDQRSFQRFQQRRLVRGFMIPALHRNFLVIDASEPERALPVTYHEYVHFVLTNASSMHFPAWYHEGFAELLSTIAPQEGTDGEVLILGGVPPGRARWLVYGNLLSLRRVMTASDVLSWSDNALVMFYAQSWALTHYLHNAHWVGFPRRDLAMIRYLELVHDGVHPAAAVEQAFGMTFEELERDFLGYLEKDEIPYQRLPMSALRYSQDVTLSPLDQAEKLYLLADLATALGEEKTGEAEGLLRGALARNPDHGPSLAALAELLARRNDPQARVLFERALALGVQDPSIQRLYADHLLGRAKRSLRDEQARELRLRARGHYERSLELEPDQGAAWAGLAQTYERDEEQLDRAIEALEAARTHAPGYAPVETQLAELYLRSDRTKEAQALLRGVTSRPHAPSTSQVDLIHLDKLLHEAGLGDDAPRSTRHLEARLDVDEPEPGRVVRGLANLVEVRGRGGLWEAENFDVVLAIDESSSTLAATGRDVDGDGLVGQNRPRPGSTPDSFSTDPGDSTIRAELEAARSLIRKLNAQTTRASIITFAGQARVRTPLDEPEKAMQALDAYQIAVDWSGTSFGNPLAVALQEFVTRRDFSARRQRTILLLSDGFPTFPSPAEAHQHALDNAEVLSRFGIKVHTFALGELAQSQTLEAIAERTGGRYIPIDNPADVIDVLADVRLTGLQRVSIVNLTTGESARAVRTFPDGSFDGFARLVEGTNLLEIGARLVDGRRLSERRTVVYAPPEHPTDRHRAELEELRMQLELRTIETDMARRARGTTRERDRRLELETED